MARPLTYSNRRLFIGVDDRHRIREATWPHVGLANHLNGHEICLGVWMDGALSWTDGPDWEIIQRWEDGALIGHATLFHERLQLKIEMVETIDPENDAFVRRLKITSSSPSERAAKLFWTHNFNINETHVANAAYYQPDLSAVVQYRQQTYALCHASSELGPATEWTTACKFGQPGAKADCEDGALNGKSMEVGTVDTAIGVDLLLKPNEPSTADWMLVFGDSAEDVESTTIGILDRGLARVFDDAGKEDRAWLASLDLSWTDHLPVDLARMAEHSLLIIRAHLDSGGAILAACDSDVMIANTVNYCCCWPRDGALVADILTENGALDLAGEYIQFCLDVFPPELGFFRQKYWPDQSFGPSWHPIWHDSERVKPIQQDETSLMIWMASRFILAGGSEPSPDDIWNSFLLPACEAILAYRDEDGLPLPSWDLWEERRGVSFFTVGATIGGLNYAAKVAESRGETELAKNWREAAHQMTKAAEAKMTDPDGAFVRQLKEDGTQDLAVDSAALDGVLLAELDLTQGAARETLRKLESTLAGSCPTGGVPRYENDYYFRQDQIHSGNPWFICSLWLAQAEIRMGRTEAAMTTLQWTKTRAAMTGALSEQIHPVTGAPIGVMPLVWSHAEFLRTARAWAATR